MKTLKLFWGLSGPLSLIILAGLTSLWMVFLVSAGLRSTCDQASAILRKSASAMAQPVLNGNLPELKTSLHSLRISGEDALIFEGSSEIDREVFGRVVVGSLAEGPAYTCVTEIEHLGLKLGSVKTSIGIANFSFKKLKSEAASIVFFWLLTVLVILISNYRALRVLGSVNKSLDQVNHIGTDRDLRDVLSDAIATVPRNAGTEAILDSMAKITANLAEMAELKVRTSRAEDKAQLARQVGHDIRSPLSALRILMDKSKNLSAPEQELLRACYQRVDQVAQNLLVSASEPKSFDFVACLKQIIEEKRLSAQGVDFRLDLDLPSAHLIADPSDMQRILSNLLNNALEAHASGIALHLSLDGKLKISDNGSGIPEEIIKKIEAGEAATTKGADHGLGLSHARKVLKGYGGGLKLGRSIRNGTEVVLDLSALMVKDTTSPRALVRDLAISSI